ncbi:MAG: hypothetical protein HY744_31065, partial [Deltaproteobacteria bacterium]|nr:hypothetical protein [Deltaproteobacteria bacterium]
MSLAQWVVAIALLAAAVGGAALVVRRSPQLRHVLSLWAAALAAGAVAMVPVWALERALERWAELDPLHASGEPATLLLYGFLVAAPLEQAVIVAAVALPWRLRRLRVRAGISRQREIAEGVSFAAGAALGLFCTRSIAQLGAGGAGWLGVARWALGLVAYPLLSMLWGYFLGRDARR